MQSVVAAPPLAAVLAAGLAVVPPQAVTTTAAMPTRAASLRIAMPGRSSSLNSDVSRVSRRGSPVTRLVIITIATAL